MLLEQNCYCSKFYFSDIPGSLQCLQCKKRFHFGCLQSSIKSELQGDGFYDFVCKSCTENNKEFYEKSKVNWLDAVHLALYNLQIKGTANSKCGFFRWKEHLCVFIDRHWNDIFGRIRKKTQTWHGTVAGILSSNVQQRFISGTLTLGESGWWRLSEMKPPTFSVGMEAKCGFTLWQSSAFNDVQPTKRGIVASNKISGGIKNDQQRRKVDSKVIMDEQTMSTCLSLEANSSPHAFPVGTSLTVAGQQKPSARTLCMTHGEKQITGLPGHIDSLACCHSSTGDCTTSDNDHVASVKQPVAPDPLTVSSMSKGFFSPSHEHSSSSVLPLLIDDVFEDINYDDEHDAMDIEPSLSVFVSDDINMDYPSSPCMEDFLCSILDSDIDQDVSVPQQKDIVPTVQTEQGSITEIDANVPSESESDVGSSEEENTSCDNSDDNMDEDSEAGGKVGSFCEQKAEADNINMYTFESQTKQQHSIESIIVENESSSSPKQIPQYMMMTPYDENLLLKKLNALVDNEPMSADDRPVEARMVDGVKIKRNQMRRKLLLRKIKREHGLPVFDVDNLTVHLLHHYWGLVIEPLTETTSMPIKVQPHDLQRTLDRMSCYSMEDEPQYVSFKSRLSGSIDIQLSVVVSPYTRRKLKPFIWRDTDTRFKRVQLLNEIIAYPHRNHPTRYIQDIASLDYCYVRPNHIPSINQLCHTWFWPGINLSDNLKYPDFSCVVTYKKLVVAFAFMVPDVKYNEAYISFIFTHPEWRGYGIGKVMLYHLCQTYMGKEITLHVSATNPAMLLYQKFGFKVEELCLDFYDKYLPVDSTDSRHAYFMRLGK